MSKAFRTREQQWRQHFYQAETSSRPLLSLKRTATDRMKHINVSSARKPPNVFPKIIEKGTIIYSTQLPEYQSS